MGKLEHAWKELRTGGRGLGGGTGLSISSSSSRFPLLRNEGRKTMEKHGVHTVWLHAQTCRRTGAQTANAPHPDVPFLRIREARMLGEGDVGKEQPSLGRASWFSNSQRAKEPS